VVVDFVSRFVREPILIFVGLCKASIARGGGPLARGHDLGWRIRTESYVLGIGGAVRHDRWLLVVRIDH
jgi:hypothetical protein